MAWRYDGSTSFLELTDTMGITASPLTMMAWFLSNDSATNQYLVGVGASGSTNGYSLVAAGAVAGDPIRAQVRGGSTQNADTSTGYTVGQWTLAAAVFANNSLRYASINGVLSSTNTTTIIPGGTFNRTRIGAEGINTPGSPTFNGRMGPVGIWREALTPDEQLEAASLQPFDLIRPNSRALLIEHGESVADEWNRWVFTNTAVVQISDHPPLISRHRPRARLFNALAGGGGGGAKPWAHYRNMMAA